MLVEPLQRGKLEEGFNVAMTLVPTLKGYSQHKAMCSAGLILFCLHVRRDTAHHCNANANFVALSWGIHSANYCVAK